MAGSQNTNFVFICYEHGVMDNPPYPTPFYAIHTLKKGLSVDRQWPQ